MLYKIMKIFLAAGALAFVALSGLTVEAQEPISYAVSEIGGEYMLSGYAGGEEYELLRKESLTELFKSEILESGRAVVLRDVEISEDLVIKDKSIGITGSARFSGCDFVIDGGDVSFSSFTLEFFGEGGVRHKSGKLSVDSSVIVADESASLRLDYSSGASLYLENSQLTSNSYSGALNISYGSAYILNGKITNTKSYAIINEGSLYLSGAVDISAENYGIETDTPINLSWNGQDFSASADIKYKREFKEGTITPVLYNTSAEGHKNIRLFDILGREAELCFFESSPYSREENFAAVYLPYKLSFFDGGILIDEKLFLGGEYPSPVTLSEKAGYKFLGWQEDCGGFFDFSTALSEDVSLYAAYELFAPEFSISSLEFTYDGKERELAFSSVSHPLLNSGEISYLWYRDGECISSSRSVKIRGVSDSGEYICKLKFTHSGNESEVCTEALSVTVKKAEIAIPEIPAKEYTGNRLYPEISSTAYYEVKCDGAEDAGTYPVLVKLRDGENYKFVGRNENEISLDFKITPAKNAWTVPLSVQNAYFGCSFSYSALAKFGEVRYTFSTSVAGVYEEKIPKEVGTYYIRAEVLSGANYEALVSEPLAFSILADVIVGISVKDTPMKLEYYAFERFDVTGGSLLVSYSSGKAVEISGEAITVKHPRAEYFLFGDTYVTLSYGGREITLGIKTKKAEYDTSGILFPEKSVVYDGKVHAPEYIGALPVGRDGIPLECFVEAFKTDVGIYEIKLIFESKSANYNSPNPIFSRLEITPRAVDVIWDECEFVYDGGAHAPRAYFINENGAKVFINVLGAASFAGEYSAVCEFDNNNYTLHNSSCDFKILKADYDLSGAFWSKSEFTYDGEEKTVTLSGLPDGVSVIGYTDNKATRAGTYLAKATLSYDTANYNPPKAMPFPFTIRRAEYSLDGFSFLSQEAVYDGEVHYPILIGDMPSGVDGSKLSYSFDRGASRVSDGRVKVTVSFSSDSENYNVPQNMEAYVTVIPKGIFVTWNSLDFIFSGKIQSPTATAEESLIYVVGGQASAGIHTASAFSQNSDYYVINSKCEYEIKRAQNEFTEKLTALDVYEGDSPAVFAKSLSGDVSYRFFSDEALTIEIEAPTLPGVYYAVAESLGGENYTAIRSEPKKFLVIELVPVAIYPEIITDSPSAFSTLGASDVKVTLEYNSGKRESVSFENIEIEYENGESLRVKDTVVRFAVLGIEASAPISVSLASYDMSSVFWTEGSFVYDGEAKSIYLEGLPDGVSVVSYIGNEKIGSGSYNVFATLSYDTENYREPSVPAGNMIVEKASLKTPVILPMTYSGKEMEIKTENADFCKYSKILYRDSAKYSVVFEVIDFDNYIFEENAEGSIEVEFEILPKEITVKISDIVIFLFQDVKEPSYTLLGELFEGDDLKLEFEFLEDGVTCISENQNYKITVEEGKIIRKNYPSPEALALMFLFLLLLVILTLLFVALLFHKDKLRRLLVLSRSSREKKLLPKASLRYFVPRLPEPKEDSFSLPEFTSAKSLIDSEKADELLSDGMAKNLIKRSVSIETFGRKKRIINVGDLNSAFKDGDRVDINRMKSVGLIPYDTAYIKVLADGILEKRLSVFANDFSLSAVKMIALMGGEAVKVNTVRIKMPKDFDR